MNSESALWLSGVLFVFVVVFLAFARGFHLEEVGAFGLNAKLQNPVAVVGRRWLYWPGSFVLLAALIVGGFGVKEKVFRPQWPSYFEDVAKAEMLATEVDDVMDIRVNDQLFATAHFGEVPNWAEFTGLLHQGTNKVEVTVLNGQYGGCGGKLILRVNGVENPDYSWSWGTASGVTEDRLPDIVCYQHVKTLVLN